MDPSRPADTSPDADQVQLELLQRMSPAQRGELMTQLTLAVQQLAFAGKKQRFPDATDDEIWLRLAADRLGADVVKKVYGFDPESR
jgi:hypothetical protein